MNKDEKALARIIFANKVYSANGQAYEDLFCAVMAKAYSDFMPIKPQGKIGDRKNDGYLKHQGRYFQVYAPEEPRHSSTQAIKKAEKDFSGLKSYWEEIHPIKEYYFAFNDKFNGSFPDLEKSLKAIKTANKLNETGVFLAKDLENIIFALDDDVIQSIIGYIPDPNNIDMIDYSSLREVISYVLLNHKPLSAEPILVVPGFDEKIEFNGLSRRVKTLLDTASYQMGSLDEYFYKNGAAIKQELRNILSEKYEEAKIKDFGNIPHGISKGDLVFFDILKSLAPNSSPSIEDATIILMTKYFESCDIFEDPNK